MGCLVFTGSIREGGLEVPKNSQQIYCGDVLEDT